MDPCQIDVISVVGESGPQSESSARTRIVIELGEGPDHSFLNEESSPQWDRKGVGVKVVLTPDTNRLGVLLGI